MAEGGFESYEMDNLEADYHNYSIEDLETSLDEIRSRLEDLDELDGEGVLGNNGNAERDRLIREASEIIIVQTDKPWSQETDLRQGGVTIHCPELGGVSPVTAQEISESLAPWDESGSGPRFLEILNRVRGGGDSS